jgi:hypothetical protein
MPFFTAKETDEKLTTRKKTDFGGPQSPEVRGKIIIIIIIIIA